MKFFNKNNFLLLFIVILATILRFLFLDKPEGLWYDELVTYSQVIKPDINSLITFIFKTDIHLPTYLISLHLWGKIFSYSLFSMKSFSAICGVLAVLTAYFAGKELKDRQTGLLCASVFAINSFLIFCSQEVRLMSFLSFLCIIFIYYIIKIKNNPLNKWNYLGCVLIAFLLIHTYTIAFIYILGQLMIFALYMYFSNKEKSREIILNFTVSSLILVVLCLPLLIFMLFNYSKYTTQINGFYCDYSSLFVIIQNYFTPVLTGLFNNPTHYMEYLFKNITFSEIIYIFIPIFIASYTIINILKKEKFALVIFGGGLFFIIVELIACHVTNFKILSRYTVPTLISFLLLLGYGFSTLTTKRYTKNILISLFFIINLFYLLTSSQSAFRIERDGYQPLINILNSANLQENDFLILWNRTAILEPHLNQKLNTLSILRNFAYTTEFMLAHNQELKNLSLKKRKELLRDDFADTRIPFNTIYIMEQLYNAAHPHQKFIITTNTYFDNFTRKSFSELVENDYKYDKTSLNDLLTIKSLINLKIICNKKFKFIEKKTAKDFVVIIYEK